MNNALDLRINVTLPEYVADKAQQLDWWEKEKYISNKQEASNIKITSTDLFQNKIYLKKLI